MTNTDRLNKDDQLRFSQLDSIFRRPREELTERFSPYFVKYHRRLIREKGYLKCVLDYVDWISGLLQIKNAVLLDVGCGFGLYTILFSFYGAREIHGADHNSEKIDLFKKLISSIEPEIKNVFPSLQDGITLKYDTSSVDVIFIKDVISHVRELSPFLSEMNRILKPGGRILITDENNALEWAGRRERMEKWLAWESKGVNPEDLRAGEPDQTYFQMRREDISEYLKSRDLNSFSAIGKYLPGFDNSEKHVNRLLDKLAKDTIGLWGEQIESAVDQILESGTLTIKTEFPYRHPRTGEFMEREFNPFELARVMSDHGMNSRVVAPRFFTKKTLLNAVGKIITVTHPLSIYVQPNFYILGSRQK